MGQSRVCVSTESDLGLLLALPPAYCPYGIDDLGFSSGAGDVQPLPKDLPGYINALYIHPKVEANGLWWLSKI
jgi:hypothetical protein